MSRWRFDPTGYPLVVLSHRRWQYLPLTLDMLARQRLPISSVTVVDDSGSADFRTWLRRGHKVIATDPSGQNVGYLKAMQQVWAVAREVADAEGTNRVLLWEEDFRPRPGIDLHRMNEIMSANPSLAHLNLQRQAVYPIERRLGYMASHEYRGYGLEYIGSGDKAWVRRDRPFTTNPGLIRREALDIEWPSRRECDAVIGGAEPAMSKEMERAGYHFGWLGEKDTPHTEHVGVMKKTGKGY